MRWVVLCLGLALLWGCKVRREVAVKERQVVRKALLWRDSMERQEQAVSLRQRKISIRQIRLSAPDSCRRQYIETVTVIRSDEENRANRLSNVQSETVSREITDEERTIEAKERKEVKKNFLPLTFFLLLSGVIAGTACVLKPIIRCK